MTLEWSTKVRTSITSLILAQTKQLSIVSASMQRVNVDGVVACKNQRPHVEVMDV